MSSPASTPGLTKRDLQTDQEVRWCPGCGDYAILSAVQSVFPELGIPREKFVIVSGIGCSSRFPYYMNTFGFHTVHGRAPAIATGIKIANPELSVWIATGDGDALSIGGNHIIHAMRRNIDVKVLMFNNRIYGLTKGQYSPTSEQHKRTKSTPYGSLDRPFEPLSLALGAGATFVARSVDIFGPHLKEVLRRAAAHRGSAFIEILQNCNIFNDGAWERWTDRENRDEKVLYLEHEKPLVFGKGRGHGVTRQGCELRVVEMGADFAEKDLIRHDERTADSALAFELAQFGGREGNPLTLGVFRDVSLPAFDSMVHEQMREVRGRLGKGTLESLISSGETWEVA